jgi:flagellar motor protein MotB
LTLHFARDRATLTAADRRALQKLRSSFAEATSVQITGYCAAQEQHRSQLLSQLARARAQAVLRFLTARSGHRPAKVTLAGRDATAFVAGNRTAHGRARNRRATITIRYRQPIS